MKTIYFLSLGHKLLTFTKVDHKIGRMNLDATC